MNYKKSFGTILWSKPYEIVLEFDDQLIKLELQEKNSYKRWRQ